LAYDAHIGLIGGLSGFAPSIPVGTLMNLGTSVSGVYVGSRADFEALNAFFTEHQVVPVVGEVFSFDEAPAAFDFMENGDFFGKIVISH
jgi:D-arabinose 1-dehydrogenase-like Zn-dependent alcohol dehydrogenase